jgi:phosphoribosylanthranilate isomerase
VSGVRIKICGISTAEALEACVLARVDYVGFVFYAKSPRFVDVTQAAALGARAAGRIGRVGLFVDADDATLAEAVGAGRLDVLQLHGGETPERVGQLRARFGLPVWKVLSVASAQDVARSAAYRGAADFILFDAKTPKGSLPGGMGLSFDWGLLAGFQAGGFPAGWGLAGGLNAGNVAQAIAQTGAPLVDASSGVESSAGVKDLAKIADFCRAARG